jgi:hypothetical protein
MEGSGFSFTPARFKSCLVFFKFLPIYSKPCLLQHLRSNSFKKISTISCEDAAVGFFLSGSHAPIPYLQTKHDLKRAGVKLKPEPSIGASHQVSVHLAKQFQRRFLEITQPETRIAYGSHVC